MKVLLLTSNLECRPFICEQITKAQHIVVDVLSFPDELTFHIARTTPHLVVAQIPDASVKLQLRDYVRPWYPDLPICLLCGELSEHQTNWERELQAALAAEIKPEAPHHYTDHARYVYHDASLHAMGSGKLNRPQKEEGWESVCSRQEGRFLMQLQTGRKNHSAARNYFQCLLLHQSGLDQELAYRLVHGSYKALSWSRDLASKWLALLAHYVPDCELQYLPLAGTVSPKIDYVHHDLPVEGFYAAALILASKVRPSVKRAIGELIVARFDRQNDEDLLSLSLRLYGLAKMLEQVGKAQIELMDIWLDSAYRDEERTVPRGEHRSAGIYRDFYDLSFIVTTPEPLDAILRGFHAGTTRVQHGRIFPTFAEYRRHYCESESVSHCDCP